jgi:integrase/recombinase XerD
MMASVETYLAVRRAVGFTLSNTEYLLRSFADFAADRKEAHIRTATAIDWASQAKSVGCGYFGTTANHRGIRDLS